MEEHDNDVGGSKVLQLVITLSVIAVGFLIVFLVVSFLNRPNGVSVNGRNTAIETTLTPIQKRLEEVNSQTIVETSSAIDSISVDTTVGDSAVGLRSSNVIEFGSDVFKVSGVVKSITPEKVGSRTIVFRGMVVINGIDVDFIMGNASGVSQGDTVTVRYLKSVNSNDISILSIEK